MHNVPMLHQSVCHSHLQSSLTHSLNHDPETLELLHLSQPLLSNSEWAIHPFPSENQGSDFDVQILITAISHMVTKYTNASSHQDHCENKSWWSWGQQTGTLQVTKGRSGMLLENIIWQMLLLKKNKYILAFKLYICHITTDLEIPANQTTAKFSNLIIYRALILINVRRYNITITLVMNNWYVCNVFLVLFNTPSALHHKTHLPFQHILIQHLL